MLIRHVLYLQHADVLGGQQATVLEQLRETIPDVQLTFVDCVDAVPEGLNVDVVITPTLPWLSDALSRLGRYRWLHFLSSGIEKIWDMPFDKQGVLMTKSSGVHAAPISEYVIGAMLHFAKRFNRYVRNSDQCRWERYWLDELTGARLTILGLGHVGKAVARRARTFDMHVVGTKRCPGYVPCVSGVVTQDAIWPYLGETDYLVVSLPLTDETRGFVGKQLLSYLKPGAVLIDVSRGGVVCSDAVSVAIDQGRLKGAALDVFEHYPLPESSPLWKREEVLVTPHVSGTTPFYLDRALGIFKDNVRALQEGRPPLTAIDVNAGY